MQTARCVCSSHNTQRVGNQRSTASRSHFSILRASKYALEYIAYAPPTALRLSEISDQMQQRQHRAHSMTPRTLELENHKKERTAGWLGSCLKPELVAKNVVRSYWIPR
ncbi:hypothetical protein NDU88_002396 [Pleurodeles waltl]|uniref:Uncharacterized protein n=1 Tax=Pleurodeles waltl TaxID=8319 RepID=A0AAV7WND2_PLEWA|nr:hypothetical protein NDU88_002396 [Pleurodeles waltl]